MNNQRSRDRVPVELEGAGTKISSMEGFLFQTLDFSGAGMQITLTSEAHLEEGDEVVLRFTVEGGETGPVDFEINSVIRRIISGAGATVCGVQMHPDEVERVYEALDSFYTEKFFDAIE